MKREKTMIFSIVPILIYLLLIILDKVLQWFGLHVFMYYVGFCLGYLKEFLTNLF